MATLDSTISPAVVVPRRRGDLTDQRFDRLVVQQMLWGQGKNSKAVCQCDCGRICEVWSKHLRAGATRSCGCLHVEQTRKATRKDLTGQRFDRLTVQSMEWTPRRTYALCLCECGQPVRVWAGSLGRGEHGGVKSCGCLAGEARRKSGATRSKSPEHKRLTALLSIHRSFARKRQLPAQFDHDNLTFMFQYWQHACAICGQEESFTHVLALDHWIPLQSPDCLGTVPTNILPLCHNRKDTKHLSSVAGCNNTKGSKSPVEWLTIKLGVSKAKTKFEDIERYFEAARTFEANRIGHPNMETTL